MTSYRSNYFVLLEIRERNCMRKKLLIVVYDQAKKDVVGEFNSFGDFKHVEKAAMQFLSKYEPNFCIVTESLTALPACFPENWQKRRILLSQLFEDVTGQRQIGLPAMLYHFGLFPEIDYHEHTINLCRDMAEVVHALQSRGCNHAFIARKVFDSRVY